jgi:hypothetical protein
MKHLSFDVICRIADGDIKQNEMAEQVLHWKSCPSCQKEIELQRSIVNVSRAAELISPSDDFTRSVLDVIVPSQKKTWYEWLLHNMGNVFAMALVLAFLGYVFSVTGTSGFQNNKPTKAEPVLAFSKIIQESTHQLGTYLTSRFLVQSTGASQTRTIVFALLAIVLLVAIDRFAGHFLRQFIKANL